MFSVSFTQNYYYVICSSSMIILSQKSSREGSQGPGAMWHKSGSISYDYAMRDTPHVLFGMQWRPVNYYHCLLASLVARALSILPV